MVYSKEIYNKAENEINSRHIRALETFEKRQMIIAENAPEIAELNRKLINTSVELSKAIIAHDNNIADTINSIKEANLKGQRDIRQMLKVFGYDEDYLDLHYTCKLCNDTGFVNGKRCSCFTEMLKKYSTQELNSLCNIKLMDFADINLSYYPNENDENGINPRERMASIVAYCMDYTVNFNDNSPSLFFLGKTGIGKTLFSSAIAKNLIERGANVAFDSIQNYLRAIENEHFGRVTGVDTLQVLINADLLILDDLGAEFLTPFNQSTIYNILNSRLNRSLPMIISSNLSFENLAKKYDDRIISRLTGMFTTLRFFGKDVRQIKRMRNH